MKVLLWLHFFVGAGALAGGLAAILDPYEPLGVPLEMLEGSAFTSYFWPGLILFTVIGLGHSFSGIFILLRLPYQGYTSSVFSWGLMIWIVVQCLIIGEVVFLHILYFLLGLLGAFLAASLLFRAGLFPFSLLIKKSARPG